MNESVLDVVQSCKFCNQKKSGGNEKILSKSINAEQPFQKIFVDLTGPLPVSIKGYRYILAIIDSYSKWTALIPLKSQTVHEITYKELDFYLWAT